MFCVLGLCGSVGAPAFLNICLDHLYCLIAVAAPSCGFGMLVGWESGYSYFAKNVPAHLFSGLLHLTTLEISIIEKRSPFFPASPIFEPHWWVSPPWISFRRYLIFVSNQCFSAEVDTLESIPVLLQI